MRPSLIILIEEEWKVSSSPLAKEPHHNLPSDTGIANKRRKQMKKKQVLITSASLALLAAMGFALALQGSSENTLRAALGGDVPYSTTLSDGTTLKSKTGLQNDITFAATSLSGGTATSLGTLAKGGTLSNTTKLTGLNKIDITMASGSVDIYTSWDGTFTHSAVDSLIATGSVSFADTPDYFKIVAREDTVLTSVAATYACGTSVADPFTGHAISTAAELAALDNATGHYYLANDIDITSVIGNPVITDFAGVLDGMGHKIYATKEFRDNSDGGIFAGNLKGAVRNLVDEIYPSSDWKEQNSVFAYRIGTGAMIKDVTVKTSYGFAATAAGGLCCYFDGGTAKDVSVYMCTPTMNSTTDNIGALCYRVNPSVVLTGVKTLCPEGMTYTNLKPFVTTDGGEPSWTGYSIGSDGAKKVMENPLRVPGYTSSGTYNGMPYYSGAVTNGAGYQILDRTMDVDVYQELRFYVRSSVEATLTGATAVKVGPNRWTMVKFSRVDGNTHKIVADWGQPGQNTSTDTGYGLGSVFAISADATLDVTPVYATEAATGAYTQVALSAFAGSTAVDGCNYQSKAGLAAGTWGGAYYNTTDISAYSTVKFAVLFDDGSHGAHGFDLEPNAALSGGKGSLDFYSGVWYSVTLTKSSGSGASSVWSVAGKWMNVETSGEINKTDTVTGAALSDFFTYNAWLSYTGYSTPVFAA
jgi:hypothetical protein